MTPNKIPQELKEKILKKVEESSRKIFLKRVSKYKISNTPYEFDDYTVLEPNSLGFIGIKQAISLAFKEGQNQVLDILNLFKDDDVYSGRIVKFEIKNRLNNQLSKQDEILKEIDKDISWYRSYEEDGETEKEILDQANAIIRELKELKSKLTGYETREPKKNFVSEKKEND